MEYTRQAQDMEMGNLIDQLTQESWNFETIGNHDSDRAKKLETAGTSEELIEAVHKALEKSIITNKVVIGEEPSNKEEMDCRAVIQFYVGPDLYDWFLNARTGYRAQFRRGCSIGLRFNEELIGSMRTCIEKNLPESILGWNLKDQNETKIHKQFILTSLCPKISKIWLCTGLIDPNDSEDPIIPSVTPKIDLEDGTLWPGFFVEENFTWLDLKGAFISHIDKKLYQPKDPLERAKLLEKDGTA